MNLYITFDGKEKIKKAFLNLRKYIVISIDELISEMGYSIENLDDCSLFIINREIQTQIRKGSTRKKINGIIYSNPNLDDLKIREIIHYCSAVSTIDDIFFLTESRKNEEYYELFNGVVFYPSIRKVHIIDCKIHQSNTES